MKAVDLIRHDALTPYALLAAAAADVDLRALWSTGRAIWPGQETKLRNSVLRHLELFRKALNNTAAQYDADEDNIVAWSQSAVARARRSANPLQRFLANKRTNLRSLILREVDDPAERAAATWDEIRCDPTLSRAFDAHMLMRTTCANIFPANLFPEHAGVIVDVGGGPGQYAVRALANAGPQWHGVLLDTYHDAGWWAVANSDLGARLDTRIRNASAQDLPAADVYVIGSLLHDLTDAGASELLRACSDSARADARLVVIERRFDPGNIRDSARDLDMQILFGGCERTLEEHTDAITRAGFRSIEASTTPDGYHVLIAVKENS